MATRDRKRYAASSGTIATTGNSDQYITAPVNGVLRAVQIAGVETLAASDTNFITWTITNLGQAGAGSAAMLAGGNTNTTRATGGTGLTANARRDLALTTVGTDLKVQAGDRLRIRAAVTGTIVAVTGAAYQLTFDKGL